MKYPSLLVLAFILSGCSAFQSASTSPAAVAIKAQLTPANLAKATQDSLSLATTLFLANNPTYAGDTVAIADALVALSASNPSILSLTDIQAAFSKTGASSKSQAQISAIIAEALGIFTSDFGTNFPTLKPQYQIFLVAAANGLYIANGKPALSLPVVPTN